MEGKGNEKFLPRQRHLERQKPFEGQGRVNCRAVKRKHPLFGQSLEPWHGWVGRCCNTRESRTEDVAAVDVERLASRKRPFEGSWMAKARGTFDGNCKGTLKAKTR